MAILFKDRVKDTSTTTGTGNFTISNSAPSGFQTFNAAYSTGSSNKFYYVITLDGGTEWEVGIGYLSSSTVLVRDTVISSSNSNSAVSFSAGAKTVFSSVAAKNFVPIDGSASPSDGNALIYSSSTGLYAPGSVASAPLRAYLSSAATYNNTAALANTGLSVTVAASGVYDVDVAVFSTFNGQGPQFDFNGGSATVTAFAGEWVYQGSFSLTAMKVTAITDVLDSGSNTTTTGNFFFRGRFVVNAGGTFILRAAQRSAQASNTILDIGSNMTLTKLN